MPRQLRSAALWSILSCLGVTASAAPPEVQDDRLKLELVAENPDIVTPVGATFDHKGRLVVIESHTHFPPKDYPGPKGDRIRIVEDTNGDSRADKFRTFYEGTRATMSVTTGPEGWMYVATRAKVFRIKDTNGDDVADKEEEVARLETKGDYPHNGLSGLTFDLQGRLLFGLGENLGEPYKLIGSDGRVLTGGGEGGNIYRCSATGAGLEKLSTGLWNPFGICVDPAGRIFSVENDPDSSPPCRLIHVVPGGDFGYQFRFGRSGKHPLQAWDGELPGTLPMVAGTGEAPCDVLPYHGKLWVTSWGDYRIERFALRSVGGSFRAEREVVVQGDDQFRPVDFAVAPDGSLYFTDWVSKSYPVHQLGRIWKLSWKQTPAKTEWTAVTAGEKIAEAARQKVSWDAFNSLDAFTHQAAVWGLAQHGTASDFSTKDWAAKSERQRLGLLEAVRLTPDANKRRDELIALGLSDGSPDVRLFAVRWIADERLAEFRKALDAQLNADVNSVGLFQATLAAIEWLDAGRASNLPKNPSREHYLLTALANPKTPASIQSMALRVLPVGHEGLSIPQLVQFTSHADVTVRREAVRSLTLSAAKSDQATLRRETLLRITQDEKQATALRADALIGLATEAAADITAAKQLAGSKETALAQTAHRLWPQSGSAKPQRAANEDIAGWLKLQQGAGDADLGWQLFFGPFAARCGNCHALEGRGASVGPDLTTVATRMDRQRLIDSILQPSREIAPQFVPWVIELKDGRVLTGLSQGLSEDAKSERFVGTDGRRFEIAHADIESKTASKQSIMPQGLEKELSNDDLFNLIRLLEVTAKKQKP